jgi:hypothetical protein
MVAQQRCRTAGGNDLDTQLRKRPGKFDDAFLVRNAD